MGTWGKREESDDRTADDRQGSVSCGNATAFNDENAWVQELLAWRGVALTSFFSALAWWLLVAVCLSSEFASSGNFGSHIPARMSLTGDFRTSTDFYPDNSSPVADLSLFRVTNRASADFLSDSSANSLDEVSLSSWDSTSYETTYDNTTSTAFHGFTESSHQDAGQSGGWEVLPRGLLYRSYLAGIKESRMQWTTLYETRSKRQVGEAVLGGRGGLFKYTAPGDDSGDAFQVDVEGAVFARVQPDVPSSILEGSDYRAGAIATWRTGRMSWKAGYYHISSHVGDEFLVVNPQFQRINYVRDSLIVGTIYDLTDALRVYGEVGNAIGMEGGAKPLELQFGAEYVPVAKSSFRGAPFAAVNGHLRQDFNFDGSINVVAGWGWQGLQSRQRFRIGGQFFNGPSMQYSFFDQRETLVGGGIWFDF